MMPSAEWLLNYWPGGVFQEATSRQLPERANNQEDRV